MPGPRILEDLYKELLDTTKLNTRILLAQLQSFQQRESEKTPDGHTLYSVSVNDPNVQQFLTHNPRRASVSINNGGPGTLAVLDRLWEANELTALYNAWNGSVGFSIAQVGFIISGGSVTIGSRGAIYVYNVTYGTQAVKMTAVETVYNTKTERVPSDANGPGIAGLWHAGMSPDATTDDRNKALV
jgi:hypothetical protein